MKQVKFYLEDEYYQVLKQKAEEKGVSISSLVREIVLKNWNYSRRIHWRRE